MDNKVLIGLVVEYALRYGIPAARQIIDLIHKPEPTPADWNSAFDLAEDNAKKFLEQTATATA